MTAAKFQCEHCGKELGKSHKARHVETCKDRCSLSPSLQQIRRELDSHPVAATNLPLKTALQAFQHTTSNITDSCLELWSSSRTLVPKIVKQEACWSPSPPEVRSVFTAFLEPTVYCATEAFENGGRPGKHGEAILQLMRPNPDNPTFLMNGKPQLDTSMCVPTTVLTERTPYGDIIFTANLTPRHAIVDLHIDQGREGLIQCIGDSKKLVLMWPATDINMSILRDSANHEMNLLRFHDKLEGGIIEMVGSSRGLIMYSGTIHATITLESGILVGINWVSVESYRTAFRCLAYEVSVELESDLSSILSILVLQLKASLGGSDHTRHKDVLCAWIEIYPGLVAKCGRGLSKNVRSQLEKLRRVIDEFLERCPPLQLFCCSYPGNFADHFRLAHLKGLCPPKQEDGRTLKRRRPD